MKIPFVWYEDTNLIAARAVDAAAARLQERLKAAAPEGSTVERDGSSVTVSGPGASDEFAGKPWVARAIGEA